jgi:hypothetical protein
MCPLDELSVEEMVLGNWGKEFRSFHLRIA